MKLTNAWAGAAAACLLTASASAEEYRFANFTPPMHTINASVIEVLQRAMEESTGGASTVRGYHGGELGAGPAEQYVRAVQGVADMVWGLPGYTSSQFEQTMIVELPDAIPLDTTGYDALWAAYDDHLAGEYPGTVPLALWTSEPNIFIMRDHEIRTPADLQGLRLRVAGATSGEVVEALGATPVQMPINQVYNALETGLIDGVVTGGSTLSDFRLDEVANSYTIGANLGRLAFFTVMNQGAYEGLGEAERAAIDSVRGIELSRSAEEAWNITAETAIQAARDAGDNTFVDLTEDEAAAFSEAVAGVVDAYVEQVGGADALAALRGE